MSFTNGYSVDEARLLLTLAASAYVDEKPLPGESVQAQTARMRDVNAALKASPYADWQIVYRAPGLAADRGNMMYIVGNTATGNRVAVRGTDWSFWLDWIEDFASLLPLIGFPYLVPTGDTDVLIAAGTSFGLSELIQMRGAENTPDADSNTAEAFAGAAIGNRGVHHRPQPGRLPGVGGRGVAGVGVRRGRAVENVHVRGAVGGQPCDLPTTTTGCSPIAADRRERGLSRLQLAGLPSRTRGPPSRRSRPTTNAVASSARSTSRTSWTRRSRTSGPSTSRWGTHRRGAPSSSPDR